MEISVFWQWPRIYGNPREGDVSSLFELGSVITGVQVVGAGRTCNGSVEFLGGCCCDCDLLSWVILYNFICYFDFNLRKIKVLFGTKLHMWIKLMIS